MIPATAPISLAGAAVVMLVAAAEAHVADRSMAGTTTQLCRWPCLRGVLSGFLLLAILAVIAHLMIVQASAPWAQLVGAMLTLLLSLYFAFRFGKARNVAGEPDPYRDLVILDERDHSGGVENAAVRLTLTQGATTAATWLGVSLFGDALAATAGAVIGLLVAVALHGRITFPAAPSIFYAGCVISTMALGQHELLHFATATKI